MIHQLNLYGRDKVEQAIQRLKDFEPPEGYYLAFSGGKDSVVVKALADMAGVKYDAHYNVTTVDPPELVQFVKEHKDVQMDKQYYPDTISDEKLRGKAITMWNLIPFKKRPPTMTVRYCCAFLKEGSGAGRFVVTGVRWAESSRRKNNRGGLELSDSDKYGTRELLDPDNPDQQLIHICPTKAQRILNPIVDWSTAEVWEFIHEYKVPYCRLYDEGYSRLGCIGCPMAGVERQKAEFKRYPKFYQAYLRAFDRILKEREAKGLEMRWKTPQQVMDWWLFEEKDAEEYEGIEYE